MVADLCLQGFCRNPKFKILNSKQYKNSNFKIQNPCFEFWILGRKQKVLLLTGRAREFSEKENF
ncbi:MAG: hypothetical protein A2934_05905 [Candidatus Sungbacteria bacterium RIFCSPLOWO2_01_FULL_47_10]|uniref:Uncharacterized protein n=1 Tax=Candidatus Sungbacteria bacterium RIFCSPLOWO2_01_FULL_47_10 TaxID=1802276 RepID=A0A1G2LA14_9BACT|nr:MAG: hypothetical protein A2934_05905 [Candidatus Sungbacteria bacterium RIFCSPLOWO2_01_FULL_47_10]